LVRVRLALLVLSPMRRLTQRLLEVVVVVVVVVLVVLEMAMCTAGG
jgi:hypothetical protein